MVDPNALAAQEGIQSGEVTTAADGRPRSPRRPKENPRPWPGDGRSCPDANFAGSVTLEGAELVHTGPHSVIWVVSIICRWIPTR